jgi:hypothetical protein
MYRRDWRGRFAGGGGGGRGKPSRSGGRVKVHGRNRKAGTIKAATRRDGRRQVSVIQRDRSGRRRVRQTTVARPYSRLPLSRRTARRAAASATAVGGFRRGQVRVVAKTNRRRTKIARRNVYLVRADS